MFTSEKPIYVTRAIAEELPAEHQFFIYQYITEHYKKLTDYLQVFDFFIKDNQQWLTQRQEEPERTTTISMILQNDKPIHRTVWVMNQGEDGAIILFPSDY